MIRDGYFFRRSILQVFSKLEVINGPPPPKCLTLDNFVLKHLKTQLTSPEKFTCNFRAQKQAKN